ncbi:MAG TPA: RNA methyltransferase [Acidimicrobiales bacterium]|nr:RNA methyltransferase [Acidimicrobiales bacterium]
MRLEPVARADDPRLADYVALRDPVLRRARETAAGLFIAEGTLVVERLLHSRYPVRSVLVTGRGLRVLGPLLEDRDVTVHLVEPAVAQQLTGYDVHRGVLAAGQRLELPDADDVLAATTTVLVLEDLTDQVNLGAVFRNAAALGADAVLLSPRCCDPLYRRSVRVSMGAVLTVPHAYLQPWPEALGALGGLGFSLAAMTPEPGARLLEAAAPGLVGDGAGRVALVLGSEGPGLSAAARAACDHHLRVGMDAGIDSLNVATAAAVALHCVRSARLSRYGADP